MMDYIEYIWYLNGILATTSRRIELPAFPLRQVWQVNISMGEIHFWPNSGGKDILGFYPIVKKNASSQPTCGLYDHHPVTRGTHVHQAQVKNTLCMFYSIIVPIFPDFLVEISAKCHTKNRNAVVILKNSGCYPHAEKKKGKVFDIFSQYFP